ncbi:FecR family protein [Mucilaginibacter gracilis]|uniref:FecR family protein n=1 Tax=Mucilaginibacter gracilis TaxID=423350 RepID=A0A495ITP9_9SPHI|nr:FecR family protein [Mucilaginibacter gracilis]RKR79952.1 FecR family protein [Mucilaginibacter gracilis]
MDKTQLAELLDRYAKGACTPEETDAIDTWYQKHQAADDFSKTLTGAERQLLENKILRGIHSQMEGNPSQAGGPLTRRKTIIHKLWRPVTAAAAALALIGLFLPDRPFAPTHPAIELAEEIQLTNTTKHLLKRLLPDGSVVWLNPNSSISYSSKFRNKTRDVSMKGICFFEVSKDAAHPFIINSTHLVTKVWGTSFRVSDIDNTHAASVTVVSGKVSVSTKTSTGTAGKMKEVMLYPRQQAVCQATGNVLYHGPTTDTASLYLWRHVSLSFENARLSQIVSVLNGQFGAHIKVDNSELNNAVLDADMSDLNLPDILDVLKAALRLNYEISGKEIILQKNTRMKPIHYK